MKRSDVRKLVGAVTAPVTEVIDATPAVVQVEVIPEPAVTPTPGSPDAALSSWKRTPQWEQNTTLRGINPQRLGSVIQARVEAAFRAGYSAGLGDSI
jgi:hypothetical protein